jgi:chitinase
MAALPNRVLGTYWTGWKPSPLLSELPASYNTIWLAFATPVAGNSGAVQFSQDVETASQFKADLLSLRSKGACIILSVGGAGSYFELSTASQISYFVSSIENLYAQLGGFDGIDFDIEGGTLYPAAIVTVARALKARFGPQFAITVPAAPWSVPYRQVCAALYQAGVVDLVAPQFYGLSGLTDENSKIANMVSEIENTWLPVVGNDASLLALGYGVAGVAVGETMLPASFLSAWDTLTKSLPTLRGAFCWDADADAQQNWSFATSFAEIA